MEITLIIAGILLLGFLVLRQREIKNKKLSTISRLIRKGDVSVLKAVEFLLVITRRLFIKMRELKASTFKSSFSGAASSIDFLKKKIDRIHERINGKAELRERGHASFFLQSVSEYKKDREK